MLEHTVTYEVIDSRVSDSYLCNYAGVRESLGKNYLVFFDMERDRVIEGSLIKDTPDGIVWKEIDGARIELRELTLEVFERDWRARCNDPPKFSSDWDVQNWFWQTLNK